MLTESNLQTPVWLAVIVSGQCVIIRGHVGEHRLEGLKAILPLGAFQWAPIELPQGEALDPGFFASIMPAMPGEVPRKIYVMPLVASTVQVDALAEVRANQPWLQWVAVVPDPEINPVLPDGILLFDSKSRAFTNEDKIPAAARAWAEKVLNGARSEDEKRKAVAAEGPKILATINAVSSGEYQSLSGSLGTVDSNYTIQLVTIASAIAGVEGTDPNIIAAEIAEDATIEETINPHTPTSIGIKKSVTKPAIPSKPLPRPQIFEGGKALPIYQPGDPVGKYSHELDVVRRDPEAHGALLEILQEFPCAGENGERRTCADRCNDPVQKWACLRDNAWGNGMPSAIVDHWLEVFALMVARVGRNPREAFQSFTNTVLQTSSASTTFSETNFVGMVKHGGVPISPPPSTAPIKPPKTTPLPGAPSSKPMESPKKSSLQPLPLQPQKLLAPTESCAQELVARLDSLARRMEKLKARLNFNAVDSISPHPANDPLPVPSITSSWEANDLEDDDLSLDALERRAARFTQRKS